MVVCLFGGGGEGFVTDSKIALSSPIPFVPEEKERALTIEKARPDQGLAGESPARCPFPPFPGLRLESLVLVQPLSEKKRAEEGGGTGALAEIQRSRVLWL